MVDDYKKGDRTQRDKLLGLIIEEKVEYKLNKQDHFSYIKGYTDNTVRPIGDISREEVAEVMFRIMDDSFRDSVRTRNNNFKGCRKRQMVTIGYIHLRKNWCNRRPWR